MDILKKLFPFSFNATEKDPFIKSLIIYIVVLIIGAVVGWVVGSLLGGIPVVGFVVGLILKIFGIVVDVYAVGGIVLSILVFLKVLEA